MCRFVSLGRDSGLGDSHKMSILKFLRREPNGPTKAGRHSDSREQNGGEIGRRRNLRSITGSVNGKWGVTGYYKQLTETKKIFLDQIIKRLEKR